MSFMTCEGCGTPLTEGETMRGDGNVCDSCREQEDALLGIDDFEEYDDPDDDEGIYPLDQPVG